MDIFWQYDNFSLPDVSVRLTGQKLKVFLHQENTETRQKLEAQIHFTESRSDPRLKNLKSP